MAGVGRDLAADPAADPGPGGTAVIEFDVNPVYSGDADYNRTQTSQAGIKFGSDAPLRWRGHADGFRPAFNGEALGQFWAYDGPNVVASGLYTVDRADVYHAIRVEVSSVAPGGRPFDGTPARVRAFADGAPAPFADVVRNAGFTRNFVTFAAAAAASPGNDGNGVSVSFFDNLRVTAVPAPPSDPTDDPSARPPAAPTDLTAVAPRSDSVLLSWTDNADNESAFEVERRADDGEWELLGSTAANATSYADGAVRGEATYAYRVRATNGVGASAYAAVASVVTPAAIKPAAPSDVAFGSAFSDGIEIAWADNSGDEDHFEIEWSGGGGEWFVIDEVPAGTTRYTDEYPVIGTVNSYRIVATREDAEETVLSAPSTEAGVRPITPPVAWYDDNAGPNGRGTLSPFATVHDRPLEGSVLGNDEDYDEAQPDLRVVVDEGAGPRPTDYGAVTLRPDGTFTYVPAAGFTGTDTFTYVITDGEATSAPATASVDVTNVPPVAESAELTHPLLYGQYQVDGEWVWGNPPLSGTVAAADADGDPFSFVQLTAPEHGTLAFDPATGAFTYLVGPTFNGRDRFTVAATDGVERGPETVIGIASHFKVVVGNGSMTKTVGWADAAAGPDGTGVIPALGVPGLGAADELVRDLGHGAAVRGDGPNGGPVLSYRRQVGYVGLDSMVLRRDFGVLASKAATGSLNFYAGSDAPPETWAAPANGLYYPVPPVGPSTFEPQETGLAGNYDATLAIGQQPAHGHVDFESSGRFTYTPDAPAEGGEPYLGWDFFSITATEPDGYRQEQWVQLDVGRDVHRPPLSVRQLGWMAGITPHPVTPTFTGLTEGYATAKNQLREVAETLAKLGVAVNGVKDAGDLSVMDRVDDASTFIDPIARVYDDYLEQVVSLNRAAGKFMAAQWYVSDADGKLVQDVQALPTRLGSLSASNERMKEMADSLAELGEGAAIAVDTANKVVTYAENTHEVLTTVEMVGGLSVLAKTGVTLLVKEGYKACAKAAAKELAQNVASSIAAEMANYAADLVGLSPEQQQWLKLGVDSYQAFALFKAARIKINPSGNCFAAGTRVLTGPTVDGSPAMKNIEDVRVGDLVLTKDQYDENGALVLRPVRQVFRRTSDHLRVLDIEGDNGNVETLSTTDEHPFWAEGRGWTLAGDLRPGDRVQESDGTWQSVLGSTRIERPEGVAVYNFEVEGEHTYFVADAETSFSDPVWVHNSPSCFGNKFVATHYSGKSVEFQGARQVRFSKYPKETTDAVRDAFDGTLQNNFRDGRRGEFLRHLSGDSSKRQALLDAGLEPYDIDVRMRRGDGPGNGWQIHHKQPIEFGGTNDFENLVLMQKFEHEALSNVQTKLRNQMSEFETVEVSFPMFDGDFIHGWR